MTPITHNTNCLSEIGNRKVSDIRGKWINWLDDQTWKPIDCSFREVGSRWECRSGPLSVSVPKVSIGETHLVSSNRWDVFAKDRISDPEFSLSITAEGVTLVDAVAESPMAIAFPGAYPCGDLLYRMNFGRAPRCEKLVRINSKPSGTADLRISFTLRPERSQAVSWDRALSAKDRDDSDQIGIDLRNKLSRNDSRIQDIMTENFRQRTLKARNWKGQRASVLSAFGFAAHQASGRRGVGIKPAFAWDSSAKQQRIPITLEIERQPDGSVTLTKVVPRAFLDAATYPVFTDTTSTFYPDPNTEVTSVDGTVTRSSATTEWGTLKTSAGTGASDSGASAVSPSVTSTTSLRWLAITRSITLFDTSAIGSGSTINSATLSYYITSKTDTFSGPTWRYDIYASTPASNTALSSSDYGQCGTTEFCDDWNNYSVITTGGYYGFPLNTSGLTDVSKTGVSKFSFREAAYDGGNGAPNVVSSKSMNLTCSTAEATGTSKDPKLVVDYTAAASGVPTQYVIHSQAVQRAACF